MPHKPLPESHPVKGALIVFELCLTESLLLSYYSCHVCALDLQYPQHGVSTSYKNKDHQKKNRDNDYHVLVTNRLSPTSTQTWLAGTNNVFSNKQSNIQTKKQTEKSPIIQDFPKHDAKCDASIPRVGDKNTKLWAMYMQDICAMFTSEGCSWQCNSSTASRCLAFIVSRKTSWRNSRRRGPKMGGWTT